MKKGLVAIGLSACLAIIFVYFNQPVRENKFQQANALVVGIASGYLPFVGLDLHGQYEGFDIDVAQLLADRMNRQLILKDCGSMASLFIALEQGMVDAIMWGLSITQSRLKKIAMVRYHGHDVRAYSLIVWNGSQRLFGSLDDYARQTICVESGSVQEKMLDLYPAVKKFSVDRVDDALFNIQYGKADAALVEPAIAQKFKRLFPDEVSVVDVPLSENDAEFGFGIGVAQNNPLLIDAIEKAVETMEADRSIDLLAKKWGLE